MTAIKPILTPFIFIFIIFTSCKKTVVSPETPNEEIATGKPTSPSPPVHGVCDYDINETSILGAG